MVFDGVFFLGSDFSQLSVIVLLLNPLAGPKKKPLGFGLGVPMVVANDKCSNIFGGVF